MSLRPTLDFMLYDWLNVEQLCQRPRHAEHNRETFDAVLDLSQKLADEQFAPYNRLVDVQEPEFDGERVHLPEQTEQALNAFRGTGLMAAAMDHEVGGMQLPTVVFRYELLVSPAEWCWVWLQVKLSISSALRIFS